MKRFIIVGVIVLAILALTLGNSDKDGNVIKIGVIAPQTGGGAAFGMSFVKGIELANADLGGTKYSYELVIEDDGGNASNAASAAQKLINTDKVKALVTVTGITGNAVKPIADASGIVHIAVSADTSIGFGKYNFTNSIMPQDEMPGWFIEAKNRGTKKVAVFYQNHAGIVPAVAYLKDIAAQYGVEVVHFEGFDGAARDFKTQALKAKQSGADTYFIASYPPALDIISKEFMAAGLTNISTYALFAISPTPEMYNGKWYTDAYLVDAAFAERFKAAYPEVRFNVRTAPYGYDIFNMLVTAFESGEKPEEYFAHLESFEGKVGEVTKEKGSNSFRSLPGLWVIENGVPKVISQIEMK